MSSYGGSGSGPGWYPDPYYPGSMRYWDGTNWTPHAQADPRIARGDALDLATERTAARHASMGFLAIGVVGAIVAVGYPAVFGSIVHDIIHAANTDPNGNDGGPGPGFIIGFAILSPLGVFSLIGTIMVVIWTHRATVNTRALGRHTQVDPTMAALGWFIPVINLWYPYLAVRDLLPEGHPTRATVGRWWGLYLASGFLVLPAVGIAIASVWLGLLVGLIPAGLQLWNAGTARKIVAAVLADHEAAGAALVARQA